MGAEQGMFVVYLSIPFHFSVMYSFSGFSLVPMSHKIWFSFYMYVVKLTPAAHYILFATLITSQYCC